MLFLIKIDTYAYLNFNPVHFYAQCVQFPASVPNSINYSEYSLKNLIFNLFMNKITLFNYHKISNFGNFIGIFGLKIKRILHV